MWQHCPALTAPDRNLSHDCQAKTEDFGRRLPQTPYFDGSLHSSTMVDLHKTRNRLQSQQTAEFPASVNNFRPHNTSICSQESSLINGLFQKLPYLATFPISCRWKCQFRALINKTASSISHSLLLQVHLSLHRDCEVYSYNTPTWKVGLI